MGQKRETLIGWGTPEGGTKKQEGPNSASSRRYPGSPVVLLIFMAGLSTATRIITQARSSESVILHITRKVLVFLECEQNGLSRPTRMEIASIFRGVYMADWL